MIKLSIQTTQTPTMCAAHYTDDEWDWTFGQRGVTLVGLHNACTVFYPYENIAMTVTQREEEQT